MNVSAFQIVKGALDLFGDNPRNLTKAFLAVSDLHNLPTPVTVELFFSLLVDPNDPTAILFHQKLASWDYMPSPQWGGTTGRNTTARRASIYEILGLADSQKVILDKRFPYAPALDAPVVIVDDDGEWTPWYTTEIQSARKYYWTSYFEYLRDKKKWEAKNLAALDECSKDVVQRLSNPESATPRQSKGLVVGFVQSGKTANFTGVVARAADAGYRLFIVLAGTIDILRDQTQRRLDKELVGLEMCPDEHYELDEDNAEFISHGGFPSQKGAFDWERLTGAKEDFKKLKKGISALEFRSYDQAKPFFHASNLHRDRARLIVVKKNTTVLDKLLEDLKTVGKKIKLDSVPALVIDDESDQASINTLRPAALMAKQMAEDRKQRTETNKRIVNLLRLLPRAQYVGYTATPCANVFIDPEDAEDLFPADFIVSLPRPEEYMGVREFYDESAFKPDDFNSNKNAFVRFVVGSDDDLKNLPQAIDAYILSGALKLFREKATGGKLRYKHHTMLVHNSPRINVHERDARHVENLLTEADYLGAGVGLQRLRKLWEADFSRVSNVRAPAIIAPARFEELIPFVGECCRRLEDGVKPVLIINGNNRDDSPNFEKASVWKILVGGTKLSRGYTVEGLTVSYYRRRAGASDTLMQMGRWFGFRPGYRDLVRLYIGSREPVNKDATKFIDLYEAFRATCLDEEQFRQQLRRYSSLEPGLRITPKQIPPLVAQHMLPPTSRNKMFNAKITFRNLAEEWQEKTVMPEHPGLEKNDRLVRDLLRGKEIRKEAIRLDALQGSQFVGLCTSLNPDEVKLFLRAFVWLKGFEKVMTPAIEYLEGKGEHDPKIDRWLFLAPQLKTMPSNDEIWECNGQKFTVKERARIETGVRYKAFSEPEHRRAAEYFAGLIEHAPLGTGDHLKQPKQAVFLFYPVLSQEELKEKRNPTMGFALLFPKNGIAKQISYTVADPAKSDAVVVSVR